MIRAGTWKRAAPQAWDRQVSAADRACQRAGWVAERGQDGAAVTGSEPVTTVQEMAASLKERGWRLPGSLWILAPRISRRDGDEAAAV